MEAGWMKYTAANEDARENKLFGLTCSASV